MSDVKLSKEEKEILKDFEAGEFKSVLTPRRKKSCRLLLRKHLKKISVLTLGFLAVI